MYEDIMRRPMFQNAQQRASSGIMTGVAPVQGFDNGGSVPEYIPKFLREEEEEDITDDPYFKAFVVDKDDPFDLALSGVAATMAATGVGSPVAALTKLVGTGRKLVKNKKVIGDVIERAQEKVMQMEDMGIFDKAKKAGGQALTKYGEYLGLKEVPAIASDPVGYATDTAEGIYGLGEELIDTGELLYDVGSDPELRSDLWERSKEGIMSIPTELGMANGGVASLPVYMANGGKPSKTGIVKEVLEWIQKKLRTGEIDEIEAQDILNKSTGRVDVDEVVEEIDYDIPTITRNERKAAEERAGKPRVATNIDGTLKPPKKVETTTTTPEKKDKPKETKDDTADAAVDDAAALDLDKGKKKPRTTTGKVLNGAKLAAMWGIPIASVGVFIASNPGLVGDLIDQGFELDDDVQDAVDQLGDTSSEQEATAQGSGFTLNQMPNLPAVVTPDASSQTQPSTVATTNNQVVSTPQAQNVEEVEEERKKVLPRVRPFGGKIARALLGEDEAFGGDRGAIDFIRREDPQGGGFLDNVMGKLSDPRTRYQLSQAAKATEGAVPRNFFTDMEEAGQDYDDRLAQREYIQAQTEDKSMTDMEKLTNFFMGTVNTEGRSPDEILSLRNRMALSLQNMSLDQTRQALAAELAAKFGSDDVGIEAVQKIMDQLTSREDLARLIENFNLAGQAAP
jgi:hypothetical protein